MTAKVPIAPAVVGDGKPVTVKAAAAAGLTTIPTCPRPACRPPRPVENQREELLQLFGPQFILVKALYQWTQSTRRVVNHVTKLSIFAMDVADDVDCSFGQSKFG